MAGRHDRDPDRLVVAPKVDQIGFPRVTEPPGFGAQRLWLAFTALSAFSVCRTIWYNFKGKREKSVAAAASSSASTARSPEAFSDSASCNTPSGPVAHQPKKYEQKMKTIRQTHRAGAVWADGQELAMWTFHMDNRARWGIATTNHGESINNVYKGLRAMPISLIVEMSYWKVNEWRVAISVQNGTQPMLGYIKILEEYSSTGISISHWIKKVCSYSNISYCY
ncbi:unnamed protein product [Linum tenue]|uniref:Uncharacterized protein n=1 Tax=Linum tenue TaxID=586396 RepID=A0AAV0RPJ9_9ROSI|nr:unnamed protein product [Linum tenue]